MDDDDTDSVHVARLPKNMRFGNTQPDDYRRRLVASGSCTLATSVSHRAVV